jgi:hypothetical protein
MTKRALAVIAVILIIPIAVTAVFYHKWKNANPVAAEWKGSTDTLVYRASTLKRVYGSDGFAFETGKFIGKISDRMTGPALYRVKGDADGELFAVVTSGSRYIFTESGKMPESPSVKLTGVFIDGKGTMRTYADALALVTSLGELEPGTTLKLTGDKDDPPVYVLWPCFGGSPVSTGPSGRIAGPTGRGRWYYLPCVPEDGEDEVPEDGYPAAEILSKDDISILRKLITGKTESAGNTAESTGKSGESAG